MVTDVQKQQAEDEQEEPVDTSDPVQVNQARKKAARTRADRLKFIKASMDFKEGRSWFFDILNRCRVFNIPYVSESPYDTAFRCGELNIGNMILDDILTAASDKYMDMIKENKKQEHVRHKHTDSDDN